MAERIGSAYVRVFFRSSGDDLNDQVKKDAGFEKSGKTAAEKVGKGFDEEWVKRQRETLGNDKEINRFTGNFKRKMTLLQKDLEKFWTKTAKDIESGNVPLDDMDRRLVVLHGRFKQLGADLPNFKELSGQTEDLDHRWADLEATFRDVAGWAAGIGHEMGNIGDETDGSSGKARLFAYRLDTLRRRAEGFRSVIRPLGTLLGKLFTTDRLTRFSTGMRGVETSFARIGKGAPTLRNDFFNIISKGFGGIFTLASKVPALFAKITESAGGISKPLEEAGKAAATAGEEAAAAGEGVGGGLSSIVAAAPAAIAALVGIELILGFAASAAMLLTGAVIALAGALTFALIGAVGAVAGAMVPLAAGIGVAMLAMTSLSKSGQHAFTGFTASIRKAIKPLAEVAATHLFAGMKQDSGEFAKAIKGLTPLVVAVADALNKIGKAFLAAMNGPGAKQFIGFLTRVLPGMIGQLGTIAGNTGKALGGLFIAVTPLAQEFLGWLAGITGSLADMGKGGGGSKLSKFFADLQPTMDSVGAALSQIIGLIFDLFQGPGQKTGGQMFQSIADNVGRFRDFLAKAKKDGSLQKFFEDAKRLADQVGNAVINIGKFVAALDTPDNRAAVIAIAKGFNAVLRGAIHVAHWVEVINHWLWKLGGKSLWKGITESIQTMITAWKGLWRAAKWTWDHIMAAGQRAHDKMHALFGSIGSWFAARWHAVAQAATNAWHSIQNGVSHMASYIRGKVSDIASFFNGLPGRLGGIASHFGTMASSWATAVMNQLKSLPGDIVGLFTGLASRVVSAIGRIDLFPHINWPSPPGWLSKITGHAAGGLVMGPQLSMLGERGPEAVVPLTGPLSAVDPAVRALAAFARGGSQSHGIVTRGGRTVDIGGITIVTPTQDAGAVAQQVVNRIAAASYI